jgi:hypothetical protein
MLNGALYRSKPKSTTADQPGAITAVAPQAELPLFSIEDATLRSVVTSGGVEIEIAGAIVRVVPNVLVATSPVEFCKGINGLAVLA